MQIEDKPHCKIEYDPDLKCVIQTWRGFAGSENFHSSILKTIEVFKEQKVESIISNTQDAEVVRPADSDWVAEYATPILIEHGLRRIAFIVPKCFMLKWSVDHFIKKSQQKQISKQYFDNFDEAKLWLSITQEIAKT